MDPAKLAKVLAMAESEHEGEALSALRAARVLLARSGLSLRDLAQATRPASDVKQASAKEEAPARSAPPDRPPAPDQLVQALRRQVHDLERELAGMKRQLEKTSGEADRQREEADRWRGLARETADKLWDLGKAMEHRHSRRANTDKRRAVLEHLRDPGSALLSDQEIGRRVGVSAIQVGHWRRRLAIVARKIRLLPVVARGRGLFGSTMHRPALDGSGRRGAVNAPRQRWGGGTLCLPLGTVNIAGKASARKPA